MVFPPTGSNICPVAFFHLYMSKLNNKRQDLWQRPKHRVLGPEPEWFDDAVIGRDPLNNMMKTISKESALSQIYTNHSTRAMCLTQLDEAGFKVCHIQAVNGHKSEESIKSYSKKCPNKKNWKCQKH